MRDLNSRPAGSKPTALSTELMGHRTGRSTAELWPLTGWTSLPWVASRSRTGDLPNFNQRPRGTLMMASILALSGCAATLPAVPGEVRIPIPVACIDKLPDKPALFTDEQLSKMGDGELIISLRIDQLNARGYIAVADALMMACIK